MKSSVFLAKYLELKGVSHIFELIGGMITHIIDAIDIETNIEIISCLNKTVKVNAINTEADINTFKETNGFQR